MKRILALTLCLLLIFSTSACGDKNQSNGKIKIIATIFPVYDWIREITANSDNVDITLLLDNGVDLHSFQPTADDIVNIATCDIFIYVGGESDEKWVPGVLAQKQNRDMVVINLLDSLGDSKKTEELKEGMQAEAEEEEEPAYDEHIWLSLKNARALCDIINSAVCGADEANADKYNANTAAYKDKLAALDKAYKETADAAAKRILVFGDRFPFRYMASDYGIDYYAAFLGCSAESEASFETCVFLAGKVDEYGLNCIIKIEGSNGRIAEQVRNNTKNKNADILTLNSMQSVTSAQVSDGVTYLKLAADNLSVLKTALNK